MKLPGGYRIATPAAVITFLFFFLPWITVSCAGQPLGDFSGMALAAGSSTQDYGGMPDLFLIPLASIIVLVFAYLAYQRGRLEKNLDIFGLIALGVVPMLDLLVRFATAGQDAAEMGLELHFKFGFFGTILGLLGIIAGGVLNWNEIGGAISGMNWPNQSEPPGGMIGAYPPESPPETSIYQREEVAPTDVPPTQGLQFGTQRAELHVLSGPAEGERFPLLGDDIMIGRSVSNTIRINDPTISRRHARLRYYHGQWFIQDQGSAAGLIVNGKRIPAGQLNPGDIIQLGDTRLRFAIL